MLYYIIICILKTLKDTGYNLMALIQSFTGKTCYRVFHGFWEGQSLLSFLESG